MPSHEAVRMLHLRSPVQLTADGASIPAACRGPKLTAIVAFMDLNRELAQVTQHGQAILGPAYDLADPGFSSSWRNRPIRVGFSSNSYFYRWTLEDQEVARTHVQDGSTVKREYAALSQTDRDILEVVLFKVRAEWQGEGIGRAAVRQLQDLYRDAVLIAFSENADEFWNHIGWQRIPRRDKSASYRPLFVHWPT